MAPPRESEVVRVHNSVLRIYSQADNASIASAVGAGAAAGAGAPAATDGAGAPASISPSAPPSAAQSPSPSADAAAAADGLAAPLRRLSRMLRLRDPSPPRMLARTLRRMDPSLSAAAAATFAAAFLSKFCCRHGENSRSGLDFVPWRSCEVGGEL